MHTASADPASPAANVEEPAVAQAPVPPYLHLDQLDAYLELRAELSALQVETEDRQSGRRQRSQRNREWELEEGLGLRFSGGILEPGFLTFGGEVDFALTQSRYQERLWGVTQTDNDTGHLLQYDLHADFLRGQALSGSMYGLRRDDRIDRRFQPTLDQRRTGLGTSWVFSDARFPMELSYDYLETDRTGNAKRSDDEHTLESTLHYSAEWILSHSHRLKFAYEHVESKQNYQGSRQSFETTRDLFTLDHQLDFGDGDRHNLRTLVNWQEESGDLARDFFRIGPQLTLQNRGNLQTMYKYQANRELYEGFDVETHRADFQLVHQWHTNLTTTFDVFGLAEDVDDVVSTEQYGSSVDWQYNRKNPWGRLHADIAFAYDTENASSDDELRIVLDEAQTFRDPRDAILRNRNALPESIIVTDTANRRVYRIGMDYLVVRRRDVVRLIRVPTGPIADGTTVFVDYQYHTPADGQLDTMRVDLNLEQRFSNGLTPYYRFSYRNQEDDPSRGFYRRADRTDHHRVGVNFESKPLNLGAEFEVFDDTIEPFDGYHLHGLVRILQGAEHTLNASTRFSQLFFEDGRNDREVIFVDMELDHRWRLTDRFSTVERVAYRYEHDSIDGVTHGVDLSAGFQYVLGDLAGELTFDYDRLALPNSEEDDFGVFLRVRRDFTDVLGVR